MRNLEKKLRQARELSWERFGKKITFYVPGMFAYNGIKGKYPALSITGEQCALHCDHCAGKLLETMISTSDPGQLVETCRRLKKKGTLGVLLSGGCDREGRLPWDDFLPAISKIKKETGLYVSVHCGLLDDKTAFQLKKAGVDQALLDVIGDDRTYREVYHVDFGVSRIASTLEALHRAGLAMIPHVVCGLYYGKIEGEMRALDMIARFHPEQVVIVSLMGIPGTPMAKLPGPRPTEIAEIIAEARLRMADSRVSLGCARERGNALIDTLALEAGVNRMVIPSEEALVLAREYGLEIRYQRTCCSVSADFSGGEW
ncbi:MAG: radical SAM protein [Deltaproteobacteria bacterium]|nr:radical SAM protein [Deltaproteobacteria bacterium]